jgi:hypothetical protein
MLHITDYNGMVKVNNESKETNNTLSVFESEADLIDLGIDMLQIEDSLSLSLCHAKIN